MAPEDRHSAADVHEALLDFRRVSEVSWTRMQGSLNLIIQRLDQVDERDRQRATAIEELERRADSTDTRFARLVGAALALGALGGTGGGMTIARMLGM